MSMTQADLQAKMEANLQSKGFQLEHSGWMHDFLWAVSKAVYDEITENARCQGNDSRGDSHDSIRIV